jgi:F-type H+-transporting ATPase subunit b
MPQLDVTTFPSQLFWLGVSFLVLYGILTYVALPKIGRVLDSREKTLEEKINAASLYREQAENLLAEYESALAQARREAQEKTQAVARAVASDIAHKEKVFLATINDRLRAGEQDLFRARLETGESMKEISREVAKAILEKLTGRPYSLEELER